MPRGEPAVVVLGSLLIKCSGLHPGVQPDAVSAY